MRVCVCAGSAYCSDELVLCTFCRHNWFVACRSVNFSCSGEMSGCKVWLNWRCNEDPDMCWAQPLLCSNLSIVVIMNCCRSSAAGSWSDFFAPFPHCAACSWETVVLVSKMRKYVDWSAAVGMVTYEIVFAVLIVLGFATGFPEEKPFRAVSLAAELGWLHGHMKEGLIHY